MNTRLRTLALPTAISLCLLALLLGSVLAQSSLRHGTAKRNANLRSGPGTTFAVAGSVKAGQPLTFTKALTDWFQLDTGPWVAAFLVDLKPISGTVQPTPTGAATKPAQTPTPAKAAPTAAPKATNTPAPVATPTSPATPTPRALSTIALPKAPATSIGLIRMATASPVNPCADLLFPGKQAPPA
jgi:hypothetical protein